MDSIKDFTISTVFILIASVGILFFALGYPALNGQVSVLSNDSRFNTIATSLSQSLGQYQENQTVDINVSTRDTPQASASGLFLVSTTATSRNMMSRLTDSFSLITTMLGNVFGLNGNQFTFISGALISLFGFILLYYVIKVIRWGT